MHKISLSIFILFISTVLAAQDKVVESTQQDSTTVESQQLLKEPIQHGIYGAPVLKFSKIGTDNVNGLIIGGEVGWILNKKYVLGLSLNGLSTVVKAPQISPVEGLILVTNYAGFFLGYVHNSQKLVHGEAQVLLGMGQAFYRDQEYNATYDQNDAYIIIEPGVNAVLNVTSGFRIAAGLSYRSAGRVNLIGLQNSDLSGITFNLAFKVGNF